MAYIVVATSNAHKVEEYAKLLEGQKVELKSLLDYPNFPGVEEDGATFRENAAKKALAACRYCDVPAFADDSGLEVEALEGRPGIFSARYAPTDKERIAKLLEELKDKENRRARFVCAIAIAINGEVIETFEGEVKGSIVDAPRGAGRLRVRSGFPARRLRPDLRRNAAGTQEPDQPPGGRVQDGAEFRGRRDVGPGRRFRSLIP